MMHGAELAGAASDRRLRDVLQVSPRGTFVTTSAARRRNIQGHGSPSGVARSRAVRWSVSVVVAAAERVQLTAAHAPESVRRFDEARGS